jgi:hydrogenase large subunit
MGTITAEREQEAAQKSQLVEMNWDPITRIVGSLGIFTKSTSANERLPNVTAPPRSFAVTAFL